MSSFSTARIKLTLWYMVISYSLLLLFTIAVITAERQAFSQVIDLVHSHVRGIVFNVYLQQQIEEFEQSFSRWLFIFDGLILIVATVASYFLSGRTLKPIEKAMKEQQRFAADVSHELRTPLASMSMEIEAYQRGAKTKTETTELVDSLQQEIKRMSGLVAGLMKLVRLEQSDGQKDLIKQPVEVASLIENCLEAIKLPMQQQKLTLTTKLDETALVIGNPDELKQVMLILFDNAVKYTPKKGQLQVEVAKTKTEVKIIVFNSGPGIAKEDIGHVFDRFYRGANAKGDEGSGLGLAIARYIVEQYGGSIAVASQPDKGATFRILLPQPAQTKAQTQPLGL